MRQREEVQEMPRAVALFLLLCGSVLTIQGAAILPEQIGPAKRAGAAKAVAYPDKALAEEWGLDGAESAEYAGPTKFQVTAFRLKDPTAALSFYQSARDAAAKPAKVEKLSVTEPDGSVFLLRGNYALRFKGWTPAKDDLDKLFAVLPKLDQSALPVLPAYFPAENRVPNSERYIVGPASLDRFEGRITPGMAAFSMGAEGAVAKYVDGVSLTIFNYPTPQMARERVEEFRKISGAVVKRTGPLAVIALGAADPSTAERLLAKVNYQATLTWNEATPDVQVRQGANFLLAVFELAGFILLMCVGAGVAFGLIRVMRRKTARGEEEAAMIRLDLGNS
jgi:hypothetical protein